jgi:RNA polymerase sigma-70 factor (ECF subfamily)
MEPKNHYHSPLTPEMSDHVLIDHTLAGRTAAFDMLVSRHRQRIYTHAFYMLQDSYAADDITQEAFVKAYQALSNFKFEASFLTWLFRITTNLCYSYLKHNFARHKYQAVDFENLLNILKSGGKSPDESAAEYELQNEVYNTLQRLRPRLRQVLVLKEIDGLEVSEVAKVLKIPVGTVKSRLCRAREEMHRLMQQSKRAKEL